jgi:DNA-binding HxlR family transcriptional regulator
VFHDSEGLVQIRICSGIIRRRIVSEYPVRVEYSLTDLGKEFEPVLLSAASFSMKYMPRTVFKDGKPRTPPEINLT